MNIQNVGIRNFILIEMMSYAASITAERVKRVIDGYGEGKKATPGTGGGFAFYELGVTILNDEYLNENVPLAKIREHIFHRNKACGDGCIDITERIATVKILPVIYND